MSFKQKVSIAARKTTFQAKKHSPKIFTGLGIGGLVLTGYLSYRAAGKFREITEDVEALQEAGHEVPKGEVIKRTAVVLAPPVIAGAVSIGFILSAYHILSSRNSILAGALATTSKQVKTLRDRIKEHYPDATFAPLNETTTEVTNEEGELITKVAIDRLDIPHTEGTWFDKSTEATYDDLSYNEAYIQSVAQLIEERIAASGFVTLNELYAALHIPVSKRESRIGALLGWTEYNTFELTKEVFDITNEMGDVHPEIFISWPPVVEIYEQQATSW